jgi:hypothetical protein
MAIRIASKQSFSYSPEQDNPLELIAKGITSADGDAGGTTVVDTLGAADGAADEHNGRWLVITNGVCQGQWKRIVDDDGTGTLTLEGNGFSAQIVSNTMYAIVAACDAIIVVDASGAATDIVDAVRDEADDYWIGYWITPLTGARKGETRQVSDFTGGTGTFVVGAFSGALAAGDVCLVRRFLEVANLNVAFAEPLMPRPSGRVDLSRGDGTVGARSGTVSFDVQLTGSGSYPLAAAFFTWVFFRESHLNLQTMAGAVLIYAGIIVVALGNRG